MVTELHADLLPEAVTPSVSKTTPLADLKTPFYRLDAQSRAHVSASRQARRPQGLEEESLSASPAAAGCAAGCAAGGAAG